MHGSAAFGWSCLAESVVVAGPVGCLTVWVQPTCLPCLVKAHLWAWFQESSNSAFHLMRCVPKSACHFFGQWLRRVRHAETDKEEKKENKGHSALWEKLKQRAFLGHMWVPEREKHKKERASAGGAVRKIKRNTVRVWKNEKEKGDIFLYSHKKDKLVEFSWSFWVLQPWRVGVFKGRFCYWLCGEIVFTSWD